jgi:DNA-binding transcriptional regulator PaaX
MLQIIAAGGLVSLAVVAPNTPKAMPRWLLKKIFDQPQGARSAAVSRLIREGCVARDVREGVRVLRITARGRDYLSREQERLTTAPKKLKRWDGKWRVVTFDIPERHRGLRDRIRTKLREAGFAMLQGSIWVYPFPCEEFIVLLKSDMRIGKVVLYMVVEELENDRWLKHEFGLPAQ